MYNLKEQISDSLKNLITIVVYSWSVEEAIYWLRHTVNLPEYSKVFRKKKVSGKTIPR